MPLPRINAHCFQENYGIDSALVMQNGVTIASRPRSEELGGERVCIRNTSIPEQHA